MSANADDLRYFYGLTLGDSVIKSIDSTGGDSFTLEPGRYVVSFRSPAASVATVWAQQGDSAMVIAAAAPARPFVLALQEGQTLFETHVRGISRSASDGITQQPRNVLAFLTDTGTVDIIVTRVSGR